MINLSDQLKEAIYNFDLQHYRIPSKIKVTPDFYYCLVAQCQYEVICSQREECDFIFGIPVEIDDTIENEYYELVYEEEN